MKTIKRTLVMGMLVMGLMASASNKNPMIDSTGEVTITTENYLVDVSILNTESNTYTLYIYNPNGELVFREKLGDHQSLGKRFDFQDALTGKYTFKLQTETGESTSYVVRTGANH